MKTALFSLSFALILPLIGNSQPGALDVSFNGSGKAISSLGEFSDFGWALDIQNDGKIVVVGQIDNDTSLNNRFGIIRYLPNGMIDNTFGNLGIVQTDFGNSIEQANSVAIQADGKIVVSGYANIFGDYEFATARYMQDGSLDLSFNLDGKVNTSISGVYDIGSSLAIQTDGKILVGGQANQNFAVVRYNSNGLLDAGFGNNGIVNIAFPLGMYAASYAMKLQTDGKIILAGSQGDSSGIMSNMCMVRLLDNGSLDSTFSDDGIFVFSTITSGYETLYDLVIQSDGKMVAVGVSEVAHPDDQICILRVHTDGSLDSLFGINGITLVNMDNDDEEARSVLIQTDGKIIVSGYVNTNPHNDFFSFRLNLDGSLDNSFGSSGKVLTDLGTLGDEAYDAQLQADGKLIVVGSSFSTSTSHYEFAVVRYLMDLNIGQVSFSENKNNNVVYPNPLQDINILKYNLEKQEEISISLWSLDGKCLKTFTDKVSQAQGEYQIEIVTPNLSPGEYLISISNLEGTSTIKVVK